MLTVTIDQSEGISGADIPEQAVKKNAYRLRRPVSPKPPRVFLFLNDFSLSPPSRSLEQASKCRVTQKLRNSSVLYHKTKNSFLSENLYEN